MESNIYWVGDIPEPLSIDIRDQRGNGVDLTSGLNSYRAFLVRGKQVYEFPATSLNTAEARIGRLVLIWPNKSVLTKKGEYRLQIRMTGPNRVETTTAHTIRVKDVK